MEKIKIIQRNFFRIFWILVIGSVFGFFAEMLYALVYTRTLEIRHGLIYGPFIQVYGMGALAYYLLIRNETDPKKAFFKGMVMGGLLEYICSFLQEVLFGTISWDYSEMFLNINGRTSLLYCFYWGIIGVFFLKVAYPGLTKLDKFLDRKKIIIFSYILLVFVVLDVAISSMATIRQDERHKGIPAKNNVDEFLDNTYPDEYLNKIYNNNKPIPKSNRK